MCRRKPKESKIQITGHKLHAVFQNEDSSDDNSSEELFIGEITIRVTEMNYSYSLNLMLQRIYDFRQ